LEFAENWSINKLITIVKKAYIIIAAIYGLSIIFLFILFFTKKPKTTTIKSPELPIGIPDSLLPKKEKAMTIAYVNTDTILANYKYYKAQIASLEKSQATAENELEARFRKLEEDYKNYLTKIKLGLIKQEDAEQQFAQKQAELENYQSQLRNDLLVKEEKVANQLYDSIINHVAMFNKTAGYTYIIAQAKGSNILYSEPELNLTQFILEGLNKSYEKWSKKKKK